MSVRHFSAEHAFTKFERPSSAFKRWMETLLRLIFETDTTLAEFVSSTTLIFLGLILALPEQSLISGSGLFIMMRGIMAEGWWAALFLGAGLFQAFANLRSSLPMRRRAAFLSAGVFAFVGFLGARVTPVSLFGAMCKVHALGQALAGLHLGVRGNGGK